MKPARSVRRMILDLTPVIDVIMILLFGVMVHSVERSKADTIDLRSQAEQAVQDQKTAVENLESTEDENEALKDEVQDLNQKLNQTQLSLKVEKALSADLEEKLRQQRFSFSELLAGLLQLEDAEKLEFQLPVENELIKKTDTDPVSVYKAVRRIEEMKKIFSFVDIHIDEQDFVTVSADAVRLDRFPGRNRGEQDLEQSLRQALEAASFNQVVLILFSYDSQSLDRTVETTEGAINDLLENYRKRMEARQFRYGRVGLVESAPISLEKE